MLKRSIVVVLFMDLFAIFACAGPKGLERTPFNNIKAAQFESLGIQMDLPRQSKNRHSKYLVKIYDSEEFIRNTGGKAMVIFFHPYHMAGVASEPEYYLVFDIVRKRREENLFKRYQNIETIKNSKYTIREWIGKDEYSNREYYIFQKKIELPNHEVVSAGAKLLHRPEVNTKENLDIKFVRQALNSIQPLPDL